MSSSFIFSSIFEIILAAVAILAIVKDGKIAEFEDKIVARLRANKNRGRHAVVVEREENYSRCA